MSGGSRLPTDAPGSIRRTCPSDSRLSLRAYRESIDTSCLHYTFSDLASLELAPVYKSSDGPRTDRESSGGHVCRSPPGLAGGLSVIVRLRCPRCGLEDRAELGGFFAGRRRRFPRVLRILSVFGGLGHDRRGYPPAGLLVLLTFELSGG